MQILLSPFVIQEAKICSYQCGEVSEAELFVSLVTPVPLAFIEYISKLPSRVDEKEILPLAPQAGSASIAELVVSLVTPVPFVFMT